MARHTDLVSAPLSVLERARSTSLGYRVERCVGGRRDAGGEDRNLLNGPNNGIGGGRKLSPGTWFMFQGKNEGNATELRSTLSLCSEQWGQLLSELVKWDSTWLTSAGLQSTVQTSLSPLPSNLGQCFNLVLVHCLPGVDFVSCEKLQGQGKSLGEHPGGRLSGESYLGSRLARLHGRLSLF